MLRWVGFALLLLILLAMGYLNITEGLNAVDDARTPGQWSTTVTQLLSGLLAVLALVAMGARHRIATQLILGWAVALVLTAGVAPVAWGHQPIGIGIISGLAAAMVMAIPIALWRNRPAGVNG